MGFSGDGWAAEERNAARGGQRRPWCRESRGGQGVAPAGVGAGGPAVRCCGRGGPAGWS